VGDTLRAIYQSEGARGFFRCTCSCRGQQERQCQAVYVRDPTCCWQQVLRHEGRPPDERLQGSNLHWPDGIGVMAPACCGLCRMLQCTSPHTNASGRCCLTWWTASRGGRKQSVEAHSSRRCRPALQVATWPHAKPWPARPVRRHPALSWRHAGMLNSVPAGAAGQHRQVSPVLDLVAGSAAGATAVLLTYPLDLVCLVVL
jgi:hypothetical protein